MILVNTSLSLFSTQMSDLQNVVSVIAFLHHTVSKNKIVL